MILWCIEQEKMKKITVAPDVADDIDECGLINANIDNLLSICLEERWECVCDGAFKG
jgi:hypothetical protein